MPVWIDKAGTPRPADWAPPGCSGTEALPGEHGNPRGPPRHARPRSFFVTTTGGHPSGSGKPSILRAPGVARLLLRRLAMPEILPLIVLVVALHLLVVATTE
jgi:hypothetical protein